MAAEFVSPFRLLDSTEAAGKQKVSNDFAGSVTDRFRMPTLMLTDWAEACLFAATRMTSPAGVQKASASSKFPSLVSFTEPAGIK